MAKEKYINPIEMGDNVLPIRRFKLNTMVPNPAICMIAKRGSGKSWIVRDILKHFKSIPGGIIICPTDKLNVFYGNFIPSSFIFYEYETEILSNVMYRQETLTKKFQEYKKEEKRIDPRIFIVMDDCLASASVWAKDNVIKDLFMNGRHYNIMYIFTMQYPLGLEPKLRSNFDYIFLLAEDFTMQQKKLYDHYCGMFPTLDSFKQVFSELTKDFTAMVISNRGPRPTLLDKIFWYKADNNDITTFGGKQFNQFHKNNFNPDWDSKNSRINIDDYLINSKKKKMKVGKIG